MTECNHDAMDKVMVSVIIPVFNAEPYLREALESAAAQTCKRIEVIMVNDGSTDGSEEICRHFCRHNPQFKLISQSNSGVSAARNKGIAEAKGEWIAFMDADDTLPKNALDTLLNAASETGSEITAGRFARSSELKNSCRRHKRQVVTSEEAIIRGLYQHRILNSPCGVLFRRSLFQKGEPLRFRDGRYEDLDFFYRAFERTSHICLLDDIVYIYRDNPDSFINTWSSSRLDALDVTDRIVGHMMSLGGRLCRAALDRRFSAHFNILLLMLKNGVDLPQQKERCLRVIREQRLGELKDPNVRLKNRLGALVSYLGMPAIKAMARLL